MESVIRVQILDEAVCISLRVNVFSYYHHVALPARISLTLSRHPSLSPTAPRSSSRLYPVSAQSYCIKIQASRPDFARPAFVHICEGVYRSMSLMSSSLLIQLCPASLVRLTWIVFMMSGRWLYSGCFVGCCHQGLFNTARSILV